MKPQTRAHTHTNPKRLNRIHSVLWSVTHGRGLNQAQITAAAYAWSHSAPLLKHRSFENLKTLLCGELPQVQLRQLSTAEATLYSRKLFS